MDQGMELNYLIRAKEDIRRILGQSLNMRRIRILEPPETNDYSLDETIEQAEENGLITKEEEPDIWQLDLIVGGNRFGDRTPMLAAIETSITAGDDDIRNAARRVGTLKKAVSETIVVPVVITANIDRENGSQREIKGIEDRRQDFTAGNTGQPQLQTAPGIPSHPGVTIKSLDERPQPT